MAVINILSPHVADLIAAGEVVERPASVIKELMENSFDAGAGNVIVEIRDGGATYIRITDDGCGMAPEDAGIAFLRHATSKLKDEAGLASIATMGFRGEALAAISSVSKIELTTRLRGSNTGTRMTVEAGDICEMSAFGCPEGTTIVVKDLFYNTPARLKFLKSDRSEASACINTALRCAMGHPEVSVRFIRDGSEEFFSPGDGRLDSALYALLGRDEARGMIPLEASSGGISVTGFVSSPAECRGNRAHQFFFVNSRNIKSTLLQSAVEQAYKNSLLTGRYPACCLMLTVDFAAVDVNVHPAKTEIRFGSEKAVFDLVYQAVKLALEAEDRLASPQEVPGSPSSVTEQPVPSSGGPAVFDAPRARTGSEYRTTTFGSFGDAFKYGSSGYSAQTSINLDDVQPSFVHNSQSIFKSAENQQTDGFVGKNVEKPVQNVETPFRPEYKILGEAFKEYIIVEQNGEILLIDKHAAHERMNFDRLKNSAEPLESQLLLTPVTVKLTPEDAELLEQNGSLIYEFGFEIEPFGEREYIIRGVPAGLDASDARSAIEEICERLRTCHTPDPAAARDEVLHTVACKAAIKAGWDTSGPELETIVRAVVSGQVKYCPHGRPVSAVITHADLDRLFKRIV